MDSFLGGFFILNSEVNMFFFTKIFGPFNLGISLTETKAAACHLQGEAVIAARVAEVKREVSLVLEVSMADGRCC